MRIKRLGSRNEIVAHQILQRTLADTEWVFGANVAVQSVLDKDERLSEAEFSLYSRGAFDFVVYDAGYEPLFALEVDGFGHDDPRQVERDLIKNALCSRAELSLLRVGIGSLHEGKETSVLEWLVGAYLASERELGEPENDEGLA